MSYGQKAKGRPAPKRPDFPDSSPILPKAPARRFIEITDPYDALPDRERASLLRAFDYRNDEWTPRAGLSARTLTAGHRVLDRMRHAGRLDVPPPPSADDWRIWHLRRTQKRDVVAYTVPGRTVAVRRTMVTHATNRVGAFERTCATAGRAWWFAICAELFKPTAAD